jgi:hypothetical protein
MARSHSSPSHAKPPRSPLFQILMGVVYLAAIAGLIVWEYHDHVQLGSSGCESPVREVKSSLYARSYERLLDWASGESASHVTAIAIPADLEDIHGNLCQARSYLADLVISIAAQHPAEIVIDKYFSPASCANAQQNTADLLAAVRSVSAPVVVGESAKSTSGSPRHSSSASLSRCSASRWSPRTCAAVPASTAATNRSTSTASVATFSR